MLSMMKYHQTRLKSLNKFLSVLPGISKLNDYVRDKKQGDQRQFSPKNTREWI